MALIKLNNQSLADVTSAGLPSGTVLQVKSVSDNTEYDTYKVQAKVSANTAAINHRNSGDDTNATSQFTVMEIAR